MAFSSEFWIENFSFEESIEEYIENVDFNVLTPERLDQFYYDLMGDLEKTKKKIKKEKENPKNLNKKSLKRIYD